MGFWGGVTLFHVALHVPGSRFQFTVADLTRDEPWRSSYWKVRPRNCQAGSRRPQEGAALPGCSVLLSVK